MATSKTIPTPLSYVEVTEQKRLNTAREQGVPWKKWGPYLSERQWGTVREDYSSDGNAWNYFSHDQARSRAYRWGEETGKALDEYAAQNAQELFGKRVTVVATVEDIADHIDHAVKVAGIDNVGIGSDFDGIAGTANGWEDVSKMPALVAVLLNRSYAEGDLIKILGENHLRVIREIAGE